MVLMQVNQRVFGLDRLDEVGLLQDCLEPGASDHESAQSSSFSNHLCPPFPASRGVVKSKMFSPFVRTGHRRLVNFFFFSFFPSAPTGRFASITCASTGQDFSLPPAGRFLNVFFFFPSSAGRDGRIGFQASGAIPFIF